MKSECSRLSILSKKSISERAFEVDGQIARDFMRDIEDVTSDEGYAKRLSEFSSQTRALLTEE